MEEQTQRIVWTTRKGQFRYWNTKGLCPEVEDSNGCQTDSDVLTWSIFVDKIRNNWRAWEGDNKLEGSKSITIRLEQEIVCWYRKVDEGNTKVEVGDVTK